MARHPAPVPPSSSPPGAGVLLVLRVGGMRVALALEDVREVLRRPAAVPVPRAPAEVLGIFELRGEVAILLDLGRLLTGSPCTEADRVVVVTIDRTGEPAGLLVDEVSSPQRGGAAGAAAERQSVAEIPSELVRGVVEVPGEGTLPALDLQRVLSRSLT